MPNITEVSEIDEITVSNNGVIAMRRVDKVLRDGAVIAQQYHRGTIMPGTDLTGLDPRVVAVAQAVWTPEVVAATRAAMADAGIVV